MAVAMRVLDAQVETVKPDGQVRRIPIADFHKLPGDTPHIDHTLAHGELITSVLLPPPVGGAQVYRKVRDRASYAFALVSLAAIVQRDGSARLAFGGVAPKPWRVDEAEPQLSRGGVHTYFSQAFKGAAPQQDNAFKLKLAERLLVDVLHPDRRAA